MIGKAGSLVMWFMNLPLQVYLGSGGAMNVCKELPRLVYISREKRPGYNHHKKAGAMNALVGTK